jgi:Fe-S-cluster containining protein
MLKVNLQDTGTWSKYHPDKCQDCMAWCCYLPVEVDAQDLVRMELINDFEVELGHKYILKKMQKEKIVKRFDANSKKYVLEQMSSGACPYLDNNKRCTIYEKRPETCRNHPIIGPRPGSCAFEKKSGR